MRALLIFLIIAHSFCLNAQLFDSIQKSFQFTPKPLLKIETRNSFITSEIVKVRALKIGLNFNKTTQIGISYNWLKGKTYIQNRDSSILKMNYISPFFEYVFYRDKHFILSIPVLIGIGNTKYKSKENIKFNKSFLMTYEPGLTLEYKFLKYFGIGTGIGLRLAIKENNTVTEQLNSPTYILKFKIYFGEIVNDLF